MADSVNPETAAAIPGLRQLLAVAAFTDLKVIFTTTPVLSHPDPTRQFTVEVDVSDSGVGVVLLQRSLTNRKLHPCAFFSCCLSRAERNYDVGNRRLLALVLAFQEWRHWLEGSVEPFVVWTDHKNLAYLHGVKRLNSRQALWALFLGCLNFTLTYHPGSKNIKPDALSCQCATNWTKQEPGPILPSTCVVGLATWQIEERIREAQHSVPIPGGVPPDSLFVPMAARGPAVGSLVQTGMPPRSKTYPAPPGQWF